MEEVKVVDTRALEVVAREPDPKLSENALRVLRKRYLKKDDTGQVIETPRELFARVAWNLAQAERNYGADESRVEETARRFYRIMANLDFLPNSPTLMNAGLELQLLSACFVLPVDDSLVGIFDALKQQALIHQGGGGTGMAFSRLRPKGDFVKSTMGVASGPVSFMKIFDASTQTVKQGGKRRGANMGILRVDHPDILEFITCKDKATEVTNFNISVAVTDKFMQAVEAGTKYDLVNPRTRQVVGQLDAREVLDKIAFQAWKNGEPGLFFIDENNRRQPTPNVGDMEATNPCVTGDTLVSTELGLITIADLAERFPNGGISLVTDRRVPAEVMTESNGMLLASRDEADHGTRLGPMLAAWKTGTKPVWRITTKSGFELRATADHKVLTTDGWRKVEDLIPGLHKLLIQSGEGKFSVDRRLPFKPTNVYMGRNGKAAVLNLPTEWSRELGLVLGWLIGDGWLRSGDKNCRVGFTFAKNDAPMFATLRPILNQWYGREIRGVKRANGVFDLSYHSRFFVEFFGRLGVNPVGAGEKVVPEALFRAPRDVVIAFLQALFTADGTVRDHVKANSASAALTSKSRRLLQGVQMLLLNLGIRSRILDRSRPARKSISLTYVTKGGVRRTYGSDGTLFELFLFGENRDRFLHEIGFLDEKQGRLASVRFQTFSRTKFEDSLAGKESEGERDVYDLTEAVSHSMVCNGIVVRNCGEQPLLPYESCNLGSIDLQRHMRPTAHGKWEVDWKKLEGTIRTTVRLLDDVIDMNNYPVKQIQEMTFATRKIGLGVMGFARMLFMLEAPYDSEEGVEWGRKIMKFIQETGYNESAKLAEERGVYPAWEGSRHQEKGLRLRNSYVTTVAPTGTLSMIADTSGGCEPEFSLIWYKRVMEGEELPYFLDYFEEVAKRDGFWSEDLVKKILDNHGSARGLKEVPGKWQRVFATAHDIAPEWHVRMQAAFQDYCDAAVSKTINMPREATVEDVKKAYLLAYDLHCKGITVYRDGSREDQVLNIGVAEAEKPREVRVDVPQEPAVLRPRPRPDVITGRTQKILTGYGALYVTVNEDEKGLFEVFAQIGRGGGYTASFTEGIARLVSLCLRSGVPVDEIIDQLEGIRSPRIAVDHGERVYSIPDAIAKAIKRHIGMQKTGVQPPVETFDELGGAVETDVELEKESRDAAELLRKGLNPECPECGKALVFEEGCVKCHACGYSEC
jgi:ribonucleoside-diphosphate reductase alpha chain